MLKKSRKEILEDNWLKYINSVDEADDKVQSYIQGYNISKAVISSRISKSKQLLRKVENILKQGV